MTMRHIIDWLVTGVVLLAVLVVFVVPRLLGGTGLVVETASMAPAIRPGAFIVVRPVEFERIHTGDVITFATSDYLVTHRVVGFHNSVAGTGLLTQGDANRVMDAVPVLPEQVRGRLVYAIPLIGPATQGYMPLIIGGVALGWLTVSDLIGKRTMRQPRLDNHFQQQAQAVT